MCMSMRALLVEQRINESVCQFLVAFVMTEDASGAVQNRKTVLLKENIQPFTLQSNAVMNNLFVYVLPSLIPRIYFITLFTEH